MRSYTHPFYIALLLFLCLSASAQRKNFSITPAPSWRVPYQPDLTKAPDPADVSDGYYLLLFEEQHHAEQHSIYRHIIRQIVSEAGIQNGAEISVSYDPAYEQLQFHQVVIRRNGQVINKLDAARFKFLQQETDLSRFIYSGAYTAYFILEDVRKGDQIEYAYSVEGSNPIFESKYSHTFYLTSYDPVVNFYKSLIAAPARVINFKAFNGAKVPPRQDWKGMQLYEWKLADIKPLKTTDNTPSWYSSYPSVQASEYKDWKEVIDWAGRINATPPPGPALKAKIAALKKEAGSSKEAYIQKAIRFVQDDIRYMGIEMGEYSHRPNNPDKVLAQRFGDCKDKSLLLVTLLKADSIPASMAYVNTYYKAHISEFLPAPDLFNHAIVFAGYGGKGHWIDPTISYQRGTVWTLTVPDYQQALLVTPGGDEGIINVYSRSKGKISITEAFTLPDDKSKAGALRVTSLYTLQFADDQRDILANKSKKDQQEGYLDYYKKLYGGATADTSFQVTDIDASNQVEISEQYHLQKVWQTDSTNPKRLTFDLYARILTDLLPPRVDEDRKDAPLYLRYPYSLDYTIKVDLPSEWSFEEAPLNINNPFYKVEFKSELHGKHLTLHYKYETFQDYIPAAYLQNYISERKQIDRVLSFNLFWTPGMSAKTTSPGSLNWLIVGLALLFTGLFAYQAKRFYKKSVFPVKYPLVPWPVSGWLILLSLSIVLMPIMLFLYIVKLDVFNNQVWQNLSQVSTATDNTSILQLVLIFELACNIFLFVYSMLLLFLFFNRRDTFPKTMIYFYLFSLTYQVVDAVAVQLLYQQSSWGPETVFNMVRTFVIGTVWTLYLLRSERVRETFIMPHPSALR